MEQVEVTLELLPEQYESLKPLLDWLTLVFDITFRVEKK